MAGSKSGAFTDRAAFLLSNEGECEETEVLLVCVEGTEIAEVVEIVEATDSRELERTRVKSEVRLLCVGGFGWTEVRRGSGGAIMCFLSARMGASGSAAAGRLPMGAA